MYLCPKIGYMRVISFKKHIGMAQIKTEKQYEAACNRINELLKIVGNDTPADDKNMLELDLISDLVADYEEVQLEKVECV